MSMSSRMRRMAPGVALLLLLPTHHVALAKDPDKLTAMDYIEIQQLVNKLSFALDYCTHGGGISPTCSSRMGSSSSTKETASRWCSATASN